jgi:hypothetical protein
MDRFNLALGQKREVFYSLGQVKPDDRDGTYETKSRPKSLQNLVRFELLRALRWNPGQLDNLDRFRLRLCENAKVKFTIVRTGSSFYFSSLKTLSRPLSCAFFAYFEVVFLLP